MGRRAWSRVTAAALLLGGAGAVTACSPLVYGDAGMTLDGAGRPLIVAAWCDGHPPLRFILHSREDGSEVAFVMDAPQVRGNYAEILVGPLLKNRPPGRSMAVFRPDQSYQLHTTFKGSGSDIGPPFWPGLLKGNGQVYLGHERMPDPQSTARGSSAQDGPSASASPDPRRVYSSVPQLRSRVKRTLC
ncbi:hypothetical protein [Actinomadura xylanilytica]|uniref:hypothetical protein n=1 Tax=Actinomadura xylanilytica TaxID=887459 RepID=UPI00255AE448|nr:hypothetical protein [Actinomadura xylanilytica]MDL4770917.1 hypothetical protein [Actinomadura xylanilytica]